MDSGRLQEKKRTSDNYLIKALSGPGGNLVGKHMH